jgi:hypothetical protein
MKIFRMGAFALLCGALFGCSRSTVSTGFNAPEFSLARLRSEPSLLVVSPEVRVTGFRKTYAALFRDDSALASRISRKLLDSLRGEIRLESTSPEYRIFVRTVTIGDSATDLPRGILPGVTGGMEPAGGGQRKSCVVSFEVEIRDARGARVYAFTTQAQADLPLYAYKTTLRNALDAAARKTAAHLSGR